MPLAINAGVRFEDTDYTSSGASRTVLSAKPRLDQNGDPTGQNDIVVSDVVPVSFRGKYNDWLPSLNMRLRSEEHTSELQSLMRISYAVFCLKKKKKRIYKKL